MNIIILGCGQVGSTLAESLLKENNDITIIDINKSALQTLETKLDLRVVHGSGSYPAVLEQAGAQEADMLIAVTDCDEINLLACQMAHTLFSVPTKTARVRSGEYLNYRTQLFDSSHIPVDHSISPEALMTSHIEHLIEHPGALQVLDFAGGRVQLIAAKVRNNSIVIGQALADLPSQFEIEFNVVAIYRDKHAIPFCKETILYQDDEVFFVASKTSVPIFMRALGHDQTPYRCILLAGGGNIGCAVAEALQDNYQVKLIEHGKQRAEQLVEELKNTTVLLGDAADSELLQQENTDEIDLFCALTNDDEVNIMSAMLAKKMGAKQVFSLVTKISYVDVVEDLGHIDLAISPQQTTISSILKHMRQGDVVEVHSLCRGKAEAIEAVAHGDTATSQVVGRSIDEITLPPGTIIGAIVRDNTMLIIDQKTVILADDHVILFVENKEYIHEVEKLFQVSVAYF